jgi:spore germination cell wall hydrolase CwlJ-like protein
MSDWRSDDRELMARALMAEAGNQGPTGMLATGNVILNRASSGKYGEGIRGVILKPGQFSPFNSVTGYAGGEQGKDIDAIQPTLAAYMVADSLLSGDAGDITGGATHFYNPEISNPSWAEGKEATRIGDHVFLRADDGPNENHLF